ncbi:dipeptide ABC transporter ATP-binding protein [Kineococcus rhizosphaerae]|uniref:Peptide/nickel transport system ATP-binding protein n=1 Tax=Kineococcus rhizosphaerae TaxID=559628 RepID=A0A2T0R7P1_9ACTN|nr:ABC transporter ATP-binding protein [Kineococcus rhizosphaerae]PRY17182.1 peptide/nickel transport system ATP-binding protein [Kineococcus rhizosphaerae]
MSEARTGTPHDGAPLLSVEDLTVTFGAGGSATHAVRGASWQLRRGEVLAVVGESGSGKSVTATSLLGLLPPTAEVGGRAVLDGHGDLLTLGPEALRRLRGGTVSMVFQDPMSALNPVLRIGDQLAEAVRVHSGAGRAAARARALELLRTVALPDPERRLRSYPHELSGGQLQRVVIAMALANEPAVVIADEPTTALDVTVQADVLDLLRELTVRRGTSVLLITHDMGVVADLADRVVVMREGLVVETGPVRDVLRAPQAQYTRDLLAAVPRLPEPELGEAAEGVSRPGAHPAPEGTAVLDVRGLSVVYGARWGSPGLRALDGVDLHVAPGEVLGLVGESGSGKSTLAGVVNGLVRPSAGTVRVGGQDPSALRGAALRSLRARVGVVFQNPYSSLDPRAVVADSVAEPLLLHTSLDAAAVRARVAALLDSVALPAGSADRYPHELSGGQRQRVAIARAVALEPDLLIADEPTSALDVSVQARILDLLAELRGRLGFASLFISHDLAVVGQVADRVAVLHRGRLVEQGPAADVLTRPVDPYTRRLVAAAPVTDPDEQQRRRTAWRALAS